MITWSSIWKQQHHHQRRERPKKKVWIAQYRGIPPVLYILSQFKENKGDWRNAKLWIAGNTYIYCCGLTEPGPVRGSVTVKLQRTDQYYVSYVEDIW